MTPVVKTIVGIIISGFVIAFGIIAYAELKKMMNKYKDQGVSLPTLNKNENKQLETTNKKFCSNCGNKINDGQFCPSCGNKL